MAGFATAGGSTRQLLSTLPAVGLVSIAFALRIFRLEAQSLWYDEAISVYYSTKDLPDLFSYLTRDNHPPLYFVLLHYWMALVGRSEFAIRFLSLVVGVVEVPLLYVLGRRLLGNHTYAGALAALIAALSPWHVWYSQETRMYSLATALGLLSIYLLLRASTHNVPSIWMAYSLASVAGLYTHYYVALLLLGQAVFFICRVLISMGPKRLLAHWLISQIGVLVLFLPWSSVLLTRAQSDTTFWPGTMTLGAYWEKTSRAFAVGDTLTGITADLAVMSAVSLAAIGIIANLKLGRTETSNRGTSPATGRIPAGVFLFLVSILPSLTLYLLVAQRPKFDPRYLLPISPLVYLAMGEGVSALLYPAKRSGLLHRRIPCFQPICLVAGVLAVVLWGVGAVQSLLNMYFDDEYARDDFRAVIRYIEERAQPQDAVLLVGGHAKVLFDYYSSPGLPVYPLPSWLIPDVSNTLQPVEAINTLREVAERHSRIWLVLWQDNLADPMHIVLHQIWANSTQVHLDRGFRGVDLRLYALVPQPFFSLEPRMQHPMSANFDSEVELVGFDVDRTIVNAGEVLAVTLYWRALVQMKEDYTAFVHLLNPAGRVYAQIDRRPANDFYTTSRWRPGQIVRDPYYLRVPLGTPPGHYELEVGLYRYPSMQRLRLSLGGDDRVVLLPVEVRRGISQPTDVEVQHAERATFGSIELLGYELERNAYHPGEELRIRLIWRALAQVRGRSRVIVELQNRDGQTLVRADSEPTDGVYPTTLWTEGEVVRDLIALMLPADLPQGTYKIQVTVKDEGLAPYPPAILQTTIVIR